jgi:nucleolar complex protein 3
LSFLCATFFSYRIRELTEKELAMQVSEAVRKERYYEYTLLRSYKVSFSSQNWLLAWMCLKRACLIFSWNVTQAYLQKLVALQKKTFFKQVAVRCICTLLEVAPHFNFCETLLASTVRNISSSDDVIRWKWKFGNEHTKFSMSF